MDHSASGAQSKVTFSYYFQAIGTKHRVFNPHTKLNYKFLVGSLQGFLYEQLSLSSPSKAPTTALQSV